ncbi:MAG TPA: type II toxin-antitoxin system prevent-host-death family antitoxin [Capsulimonadaceae bacterium]
MKDTTNVVITSEISNVAFTNTNARTRLPSDSIHHHRREIQLLAALARCRTREHVTITKNGVPVARLVGVAATPVTAAAAIAHLSALAAPTSLGGESVAAMVAEGRKR